MTTTVLTSRRLVALREPSPQRHKDHRDSLCPLCLCGDVSVRATGTRVLELATRFWFAITVIGQWAFLYYIVALYGSPTIRGSFEEWNRNRHLLKGYVAGDTAGNLTFAAHALLAAIIALGGVVQLVPQIRERAKWLHRWNGRLFVFTAIAVSITGLYMVWVRGASMSTANAIGSSLDAVLIIAFSALTARTAIARDVARHRRWALRTFVVANGQWFMRIGFFAWTIVGHGRYVPEFFSFWNFGSYLVPLLVLELYLHVRRSGAIRERFAFAGVLTVFTLLTATGIAGIAIFLWTTVLARI